ncbi:hypothetical protein [Pseudoxanthomonas sp. PXM05]|uniref:hypothetical protein n=1 Tax=Pseudoxanthomonas sp. PXM05 TaxID=2854775 RepID=UPI001C4506DC|nr:hypothetical protein [Pseudoxanthomonas sp. PXM05]MBV7475367.1 hypothetical protein [Pseudoxanthomonas sp. PXM05]
MLAITKLRRSGLSTKQIADGLGVEQHTVRAYERFDRFPTQRTYLCVVELAESRRITLLARDFLPPARNAQCEPGEGGR